MEDQQIICDFFTTLYPVDLGQPRLVTPIWLVNRLKLKVDIWLNFIFLIISTRRI